MNTAGRIGVGLMWIAVALGSSACGKSKIAQCNRLIEVANAQESRLNTQMNQMNASNGDPAQIEALAGAFEQSGRQIAGVQLSDPPLQALAREYQTVINRFVTVARTMAGAARQQNADAINAAIPQLQQIETQSTAVVNRINTYCQAL